MQVRKANSELETCKGSFFIFLEDILVLLISQSYCAKSLSTNLFMYIKKFFLCTVISHQSFEGYGKYLPKKAPFIYGNNQDVIS